MPNTDAFALKKSGLNAFLFAEVGIEQNGSPLTILSVLARLGKDPWAQAEEWAKMPDPVRIDFFARDIVQMPLRRSGLIEARTIAEKLVKLLPANTRISGQATSRVLTRFKTPDWLPLALFAIILGVVVVAGALASAPLTTAPVAQAVERQ